MVTPELEQYVQSEKQRGVTAEALRGALLDQGWAQPDIDAVLPPEPAKPLEMALPTVVESAPTEQVVAKPKVKRNTRDILLWSAAGVLLILLIIGILYVLSAGKGGKASSVQSTPTTQASVSPSTNPSASPTATPVGSVSITSQSTGVPILSYTVPANWSQEAYYPQGTGNPISAFPTSADKQNASFSVASNIDVSSDKLYRSISGTIQANKPVTDLSTYDRFTTDNPHYDKLLLEAGTFTRGTYRCEQVKDGSAYGVNCFVINNGSLLNYVLHTTKDYYTADVQALYAVVESTVVL